MFSYFFLLIFYTQFYVNYWLYFILTGCLIKRHKIPLPNFSNNNDYYHLLDLNVGVTVEFYGKQLTIIGADNFTRDFLKKAGVDVPENLSMPIDPYFLSREKVRSIIVLNVISAWIRKQLLEGGAIL